MPAIRAIAPGKVILFGEHAVVYGQPAIAVPVEQVQAQAVALAEPRRPDGFVLVQAPDIGLEAQLEDLPEGDPLATAVRSVLRELNIRNPPACTLRVSSTIPIASGLGSGAAVSVALIRAYASFLGRPLEDARVSALAYEVERLHHGTPSGIDNTVVTYRRPVYFVRGKTVETFYVTTPFTLVIADTGIHSPTAVAVGDVRKGYEADPEQYEALFEAIGRITKEARAAIDSGHTAALGPLMDENHALLVAMGVSSPELDRLAHVALDAGALGSKLSGGGRGGNMIALVENSDAERITQELLDNGAVRTITTMVGDR